MVVQDGTETAPSTPVPVPPNGDPAKGVGAPARGMWAKVVRDGEGDDVAVEEPLEIRVDGGPLAVTMRTPGHDEELALGFLSRRGADRRPARRRAAPATSPPTRSRSQGPLARDPGSGASTRPPPAACAGRARSRRSPSTRRRGAAARRSRATLLAGLPDRLRQPRFERTGGLHATGLFTPDGRAVLVREDVGRHNAMDKVIGRALLDGALPLRDRVLCVSGRLSFELVQKAAVAGARCWSASARRRSLAVELAADRDMTLCGFAREGRVNVYAGGRAGRGVRPAVAPQASPVQAEIRTASDRPAGV